MGRDRGVRDAALVPVGATPVNDAGPGAARSWRWWSGLSQVQRFDLIIRWSHYLVLMVVAASSVMFLNGNRDASPAAFVVVGAASAGLAVVCGFVIRDSYAAPDGGPSRLLPLAGAFAAAGAVLAVVVSPDPQGHGWLAAAMILLTFLCALLLLVSTLVCIAIVLAAIAVPLALDAMFPSLLSPGFGPAWVVTLTAGGVAVIGGVRGNLWMLRVVRELDQARAVQARLAVAEERLRFARDLHDVLGSSLSLVALKSDLAAQLVKRGRPEAADEMLGVRQIAQELLTELRDVVSGYRATSLDVELAGARSVLGSAGVQCRVVGDAGGLPGQVQETLGWVVREGVTNVLRHSTARSCRIELRRVDDDVTFTVDNDGVASPGGVVTPGSGLLGLTERLGAVGGTLDAGYLEDGFRLTASIPICPSTEDST
jgi:two-component system sensor histidine kinase DesK